MSQTKTDSIKECVYNLIVGLAISWALMHILFWAYGLESSPGTQEQFVGWFTLASFARQYVIRRLHVWKDHREKEKMRARAVDKIVDFVHREHDKDTWKGLKDSSVSAALVKAHEELAKAAKSVEPPMLTQEVSDFDVCPAPANSVLGQHWSSLADQERAYWHQQFASLPRVDS